MQVFLHAIGSRGPTWFSRTTNGGRLGPARMIYDPGTINQTIGNQIVVLPNGNLLDFFDLIFSFKNSHKIRGFNVAFIRSSDKGATWSGAKIIDKLNRVTVRDPDTSQAMHTADFNPDVAVDPPNGNLYAVWQDCRFSGGTRKRHRLRDLDRRREQLVIDRQARPELRRNVRLPALRGGRGGRDRRRFLLRLPQQHARFGSPDRPLVPALPLGLQRSGELGREPRGRRLRYGEVPHSGRSVLPGGLPRVDDKREPLRFPVHQVGLDDTLCGRLVGDRG